MKKRLFSLLLVCFLFTPTLHMPRAEPIVGTGLQDTAAATAANDDQPVQYELTVIDPDNYFEVIAINNNGTVLLEYYDNSPLADVSVWRDGVIESVISGAFEYVSDINDSDVIAGACSPDYDDIFSRSEACIWKNGVILQTIGRDSYAINANNQVLTSYSGSDYQAIDLYDENNSIIIVDADLGPSGEGQNSPGGLNNFAQVVGTYDPDFNATNNAFFWSDGTLYNLNNLIADEFDFRLSAAYDINDKGQVIGSTDTSHSFLYENGSVVSFGDIHIGLINNKGQMTCSSDGLVGLFREGTCIALNSMIDPLSGWTVTSIEDFNDHAQMVGYGELDGEAYPILLNAVPESMFKAEPKEGPAPLTVDFIDESYGVIEAWEWDFGDGTSSDEMNPSHIYHMPGLYSVSLTVTGPHGTDIHLESDYVAVACVNQIYFKDADEDGYGDPSDYVYTCLPPENYFHPTGISEIIFNGSMEDDADWADWKRRQ